MSRRSGGLARRLRRRTPSARLVRVHTDFSFAKASLSTASQSSNEMRAWFVSLVLVAAFAALAVAEEAAGAPPPDEESTTTAAPEPPKEPEVVFDYMDPETWSKHAKRVARRTRNARIDGRRRSPRRYAWAGAKLVFAFSPIIGLLGVFYYAWESDVRRSPVARVASLIARAPRRRRRKSNVRRRRTSRSTRPSERAAARART